MTDDPEHLALEAGDAFITALLLCEGRGCEADEVRQIVAGMRMDLERDDD